jgi:hypothetical protein
MMMNFWRTTKVIEKSQSDKFKEAARELGADTDEETFDRVLGKIAPSRKNNEDDDSDGEGASE